MLRAVFRTSRALPSRTAQAHTFPKSAVVHSAAFFTASIGIGACPKRRTKQSNAESGEDAYFLTKSPDSVSAGVFDGVGGWADSGVDPSIFSMGLAKHCSASKETNPLSILTHGYNDLQRDIAIKMGSSTACVATLSLDNAQLTVANLGDSGFLLADREGTVIYESTPQTYFFNAPYQLAKMPASMRKTGSLENLPADSDVTVHDLSKEGFVIIATDGFFDNVFAHDAQRIIKSFVTKRSGPRDVDGIAKALVDEAVSNGRSRTKNGPFAVEASKHRLRFNGGKEDDVVVIVISVQHDDLNVKAKI